MPKKVEFIKDCDGGKIGEIKNYSKSSADSLVNQGYAKYIISTTTKIISKKSEIKLDDLNNKLTKSLGRSPIEQEELINAIITKYDIKKGSVKLQLKHLKSIRKQENKSDKKDQKENKTKEEINEEELLYDISEIVKCEPAIAMLRCKDIAKNHGIPISIVKAQYNKELSNYKYEQKIIEKNSRKYITPEQIELLKRKCPDNKLLQNYIKLGIDTINVNAEMIAECTVWLKTIRDDSILSQYLMHVNDYEDFDGATEIVSKHLLSENEIYTTKEDIKSEVWIYKDGCYVPNGRSEIMWQTRTIMAKYYNRKLVNFIIDKVESDTFIEIKDFFKETAPYEVPVDNGILNLKTKELTDFDSKRIFFSKLPVTYKTNAKCPKIDKFLSEVLACPEDKNVFYEIAGLGLVKEYFIEKAFMLVGNGRNGKSKSIELLKRLVGVHNCSSVPLYNLRSDSFEISELHGKHFNLAGDLSSTALKDTGIFKELTGRDPISSKRKFKTNLDFTNYANMVFGCNDLPRVYDMSDGFWERWILLEFPYKFVDKDIFDAETPEEKKFHKIKDPEIIDKITTPDEMSGFLNMALEGLHRLIKNKKFSYTRGTADVKDKWIRRSDSFMAFCLDNIDSDKKSSITKSDVRSEFKDYCVEHSVGGVSDKAIKATLQEMYGVGEEYTRDAFGGNQEWSWTGIKFKEIKSEDISDNELEKAGLSRDDLINNENRGEI